jgi:hypothetical protein
MRGLTVKRWILLAAAVSALVGFVASTASARTLHFEVTVAVTGPGRVTAPAPDGTSGSIDCPGQCSALVLQNSLLTLTATPDAGAELTAWGGSCVDYGSQPTCTLTLSGPKSVTAGFGAPPPPAGTFTLTVVKAGIGTGYVGGAGGIDCGPTCSATLTRGSTIALVAVPDEGSRFAGWTGGGCSGTDKCTVTLGTDLQVTATFDHVDRAPPHIRTIPGSGARGTTAELRFRVYDDSGMSREILQIMKGKATIARIDVPIASVLYGRVYSAHWRVPRGQTAGLRLYCAVAIDPAGNRSTRSCSSFRIA